jgi:hypothetical protein
MMKYCINLMEKIYISRTEVQRCSLEFVISPFLEYKFGIWGLRFEQGWNENAFFIFVKIWNFMYLTNFAKNVFPYLDPGLKSELTVILLGNFLK